MTGWVLLSIVALPALMSLALVRPGARRLVHRLVVVPPLLALAASMLPPQSVHLRALLLGLDWQYLGPARVLLPVIALVWLGAAWQLSRGPCRLRMLVCFLLTMSGSLGAVAAADGSGFYLFYSVASIAAYGLILDAGVAARRAARLYLSLALFGEFLFLVGLVLAQVHGGGAAAGWCILFGLGAKLGVLPFHVALPPAYGCAPPAGAAALGGALTTMAVLGWLRFLPLADQALPQMAQGLVVLGLVAAYLGAAAGILQRAPQALLGYSTVSQMGILTAGVGLGAALGWQSVMPALLAFAVHHGLTKAALLLGTGAGSGRARLAVLVGLGLLSLALAGLPLTGGALAKGWLEELARGEQASVAHWLHQWLPGTSVATVLLMSRYMWLSRSGGGGPSAPFWLLAAAALVAPWLYAWGSHPHPAQLAFDLQHLLKALLPVLAGLVLAAGAGWWARRRGWQPRLPAGDLAVWVAPWLTAISRRARRLSKPVAPELDWLAPWRGLPAVEHRLLRIAVAGALYLILVVAVLGLALWGG